MKKMKKLLQMIAILTSLFLLFGCAALLDELLADNDEDHFTTNEEIVTPLSEVTGTDIFQKGALEHILEGELNRKGSAVGFHYDRLPSKKGEIIEGSQSGEDEHGVYEAEVKVSGVEKTSNRGRSTFFPDDWDTQDVVDAIHEAYDNREFLQGNTYEGLTDEGIIIQMYLNNNDQIISAFPVYEGD